MQSRSSSSETFLDNLIHQPDFLASVRTVVKRDVPALRELPENVRGNRFGGDRYSVPPQGSDKDKLQAYDDHFTVPYHERQEVTNTNEYIAF